MSTTQIREGDREFTRPVPSLGGSHSARLRMVQRTEPNAKLLTVVQVTLHRVEDVDEMIDMLMELRPQVGLDDPSPYKPACQWERSKERTARMKFTTTLFTPTGETRIPLAGEWFLGDADQADTRTFIQADGDEVCALPIYTIAEEEIEIDVGAEVDYRGEA